MAFLLYLLIFLSFTDLFAQLPVVSTYAKSLGAASGLIGLIVGSYSLSNLLSNVYSGWLVDRAGPKKVLVAGFWLNGAVLFFYALAGSPEQLLAVRFLNGMTAGVITPAVFTYLSFLNLGYEKGKSMALSGAAVGLAAILAPAFSGIISSKFGTETVYLVIAAIMFAGGLLSLALKPVSSRQQAKKTEPALSGKDVLNRLFKNKGLIISYTGVISLAVSQGILAYMLPLKVEELNMESHISGMLISIFGIVAILFFLLPTNRIFDRFKNELILAAGLLIVAVSQTITSSTEELAVLIFSMSIYGIGFAMIFPSSTTLVSTRSDESFRGKAFGLFYAFFSLGSFLGTAVTGMFSLTPDKGLLSAGIYLALIAAVILLIYKMWPERTSG